ncbi:MAG: methyltransferase [Thermoplasmata archaeon]
MKVDPSIIIECDENVYEPAEDTYLLIESLEVRRGERVLEIGSGTGIVSLHCAKAGADVTATDISEDAVRLTESNASRNMLHLKVLKSDLFEGIEGQFDLIVFNPPYLPEDAREDARWSGGPAGLEIIGLFLRHANEHLRNDGRIVLILSSLTSLGEFNGILDELGFASRTVREKELFFEKLYAVELRRRFG